MGKIFEALEKAGQGQEAQKPTKVKTDGVPSEKAVKPAPENSNGSASAEKIISLQNVHKSKHAKHLSPHLITYHKPYSQEAEIFKQLRTTILFPSEGKPPKTIMITSAVPGEGKSFTSANLAVSIAKGIEEHVLLMDCDMRRPTIHGLFGMQTAAGLSDYLTNGDDLSSLLVKTPLSKLTLLPGGHPPSNPTELLSSKQMTDLLDEVKNRYDARYIIIDSPPPTMTAESGALARRVDGILLVIKAKKTSKQQVDDLLEIVGKEKIIGVLMNWYDPALPRYFGYGKYGKYYHKEK
jgi:exopolysaccharide/PEP-CTERM locus tyrosine autokinase